MKKILSAVLSLILILGIAAVSFTASSADASSFSDVSKSRWSYDSISYAVGKGYMDGTGGGKFSPAVPLTRAMVATVLYRREGSPAVTGDSGFSDVKAGQWYSDAITWARNTGVVNGLTDKTFGPSKNITREQLATMLYRYSNSAPVSVPERADLNSFPDGSSVSDWAEEAVSWAVESELIKGTDKGNIDPSGNATREQFAAIAERYDYSFSVAYRDPVFISQYTEPDYPLVTDADFYVSEDGDDAADGSFEHPFATFGRAAEAVRSLDRNGRDGITVAFMAGQYGPVNISLTAEDSGTKDCPVTYCKYGDGDVIINNGTFVDGSKFEPISKSEKSLFRDNVTDDIMKADLSDVISKDQLTNNALLISETGLCNEACYPNRYPDGSEQLLVNIGNKIDDDTIEITHNAVIRRLSTYHTYENLRFSGTFAHTWYHAVLDLASYDPETHYAVFSNADKITYGISDSHVNRFEISIIGASEELDNVNEYWIDPDNLILYVYKPSGDYGLALAGTFFDMQKTEYLSFIGLDFRNTTGGIAYIDGHDITFDRCSVIGAGANLFKVPNAGIYNFKLINSEFGQLAAGIGRLDDSYPRKDDGDFSSCGIVIDNNYIHNFAIRHSDPALALFQTRGAQVTHNIFERGGRCGIELWGSSCVTIEYNIFDRMMMNSTDGGSVYDNQGIDRRDIFIRHNAFINMRTTQFGEYAVYLDQQQCGAEVSNNLFYNGGGRITLIAAGRDNKVCDNAVIATEKYKSGVTILGSESIDDWYKSQWESFFRSVSDPFSPKAVAYRERWSDIFNVRIDTDDPYDPDSYLAPNNTVTGNMFFSINGEEGVDTMNDFHPDAAAVSTIKDNYYWTTDVNIIFVNPSRGDYRLSDGAEFPDLEFEKIGRY